MWHACPKLPGQICRAYSTPFGTIMVNTLWQRPQFLRHQATWKERDDMFGEFENHKTPSQFWIGPSDWGLGSICFWGRSSRRLIAFIKARINVPWKPRFESLLKTVALNSVASFKKKHCAESANVPPSFFLYHFFLNFAICSSAAVQSGSSL